LPSIFFTLFFHKSNKNNPKSTPEVYIFKNSILICLAFARTMKAGEKSLLLIFCYGIACTRFELLFCLQTIIGIFKIHLIFEHISLFYLKICRQIHVRPPEFWDRLARLCRSWLLSKITLGCNIFLSFLKSKYTFFAIDIRCCRLDFFLPPPSPLYLNVVKTICNF